MTRRMLKFALIPVVFAVCTKMFRTDTTPQTFAFDKKFPEDGTTWSFEVVMDDEATALTELEKNVLDKLEMSPMYRCGSGIYGERWIGKGIYSFKPIKPLLLRLYKLRIEDTDPPGENKFRVRHQILGKKSGLDRRYDEFVCAKPKQTPCTEWTSLGYVAPTITKKITRGKTEHPWYKQKLTMVPKSNNQKTCPLVNESWWCLWLFCPTNKS